MRWRRISIWGASWHGAQGLSATLKKQDKSKPIAIGPALEPGKQLPVPDSIASVDPTIAIPERFVAFADDYFSSLNTQPKERIKNYEWIDQFHDSTNNNDGSFSLLSWNILAQSLYTEEPILPWATRLDWIVETLQNSQADVICLQEVEDAEVFDELLEALRPCGYHGVVQGGPGVKDIKRRAGKGERAHRVATFWKVDVFQVISSDDAHLARGRTMTSLLQTKDEAVLAVVNCHLEGHPNQYAARIRQLQHSLNDLATRVESVLNGLIIAGDFNCELASSACSTYLRIGRVGRKGGLGGINGSAALVVPPAMLESEEAAHALSPILEWGQALPNEEMESVKAHPFRRNSMLSAYPPQLDSNLHFTYCARPFRPVSGLDQIWFSSLSLKRKALRRACKPTARNIILHSGLPEVILQQPSDHLPVGAVFEWKGCSQECDAYRPQKCSDAGVRELIVVPDHPPPAPKPLSPIMAYAELDLLVSTCPYDSDSQRIQLESILDHKLPRKDKKPCSEELTKLSKIRDVKKDLITGASEPARHVIQRILKLKKDVSKYEEMGLT